MGITIVGFQMGFKITQGINPGAATLTNGCTLFGGSHRQFSEHGRQQ
jgi:hypothetical protein